MSASHCIISFSKFCRRYFQLSAKEGQLGNISEVAHTSANTLYVTIVNDGPMKLGALLMFLTLIICRGLGLGRIQCGNGVPG
jgi:hypothetical protein